LTAVFAVIGILLAVVALATGGSSGETTTVVKPAAAPAPAAPAAAPTLAAAKGIEFTPFERVDPTLPKVPAGAVKKFTVDVLQDKVQVAKDLAPMEAWTYTVNGKAYRGTAASPPIVVNQGDKVEITFVNGGSKAMNVNMPHSIDFHSAEVAPSKYYKTIAPGQKLTIPFVAKHPGVFMYHCATQPILQHTSAGMMGMMVVKPKHMPKVDRELFMVQEEFYLGKPGAPSDLAKLNAGTPDAFGFNGFANQYKDAPIVVKKGEKIRMYVLDAGPSKWSAFHVIGTVFDKAVVENTVFAHSQTINLAPSQGGWVEFTLDQEGSYPFVTHSFGDMTKGALGVLATENAPKAPAPAPKHGEPGHDHATMHGQASAGAANTVNVEMGDMFIKADKTSVKAGDVTFAVKNTGATMHAMATAITPVKADGGMLDESQLQNKAKQLMGGESTTIAAKLAPGSYELVCYVPGHYAAGQKLAFQVK
jgi:nitrite reductase (NO-forming)